MKNFELITELMKLPAGLDVKVSGVRDNCELEIMEQVEDTISYGLDEDISEVFIEDGKILINI
jgi:hypothetical protein